MDNHRSKIAIFFLALATLNSEAFGAKPLALVYRGPGACFNCWTSAAQTVKRAGYRIRYVGPRSDLTRFLPDADLWVQPGGKSTTAAEAMGAGRLQAVREFVANGGNYLGFCAGGFLATQQIGTSGKPGLGIVPGRTELWDKRDGPGEMIDEVWSEKTRSVYYHGGPYFDLKGLSDAERENVRVVARYIDGLPSAMMVRFGKGAVVVTGAHPEASRFWKAFKRKNDRDGSDQPQVIQMMDSAFSLQK